MCITIISNQCKDNFRTLEVIISQLSERFRVEKTENYSHSYEYRNYGSQMAGKYSGTRHDKYNITNDLGEDDILGTYIILQQF